MRTILVLIAFLLAGNLLADNPDTVAALNVDSIVRCLDTKKIKDPDELAAVITEQFETDTLKVRAIYCWVVQNIAYNYAAYRKGTQHLPYKGEGIEAYNYKRICKTITTKKGVCEDYALVFQYLCKANSIKCEKVTGWVLTSKPRGILKVFLSESSSNHAWNAVMINGKWHLVDATFGSGYVDLNRKKFIRCQNDYYYLTPPEDSVLDHHPKEKKWQLLDKPLTIKEFINNAKRNREAYLANSRKALEEHLNKGKKRDEFSCQ